MSAFVGCGSRSCTCRIRIAWLECPLTPLRRSLLFARRERTVELAVDEEIGENAARTPWDTIRPSLDARGSLFVNEDVAAYDQLIALSVVRTTETVCQSATETCLKNHQGILGGFDVTPPCRDTRRGLSHTHIPELVCFGKEWGRE